MAAMAEAPTIGDRPESDSINDAASRRPRRDPAGAAGDLTSDRGRRRWPHGWAIILTCALLAGAIGWSCAEWIDEDTDDPPVWVAIPPLLIGLAAQVALWRRAKSASI
jgi:hypothetical protein